MIFNGILKRNQFLLLQFFQRLVCISISLMCISGCCPMPREMLDYSIHIFLMQPIQYFLRQRSNFCTVISE